MFPKFLQTNVGIKISLKSMDLGMTLYDQLAKFEKSKFLKKIF